MSTLPGLTAVIAGVIGKHYPGDPALPAAIARAVVEFATTRDARQRMSKTYFACDGTPVDALVAATRAALGEET